MSKIITVLFMAVVVSVAHAQAQSKDQPIILKDRNSCEKWISQLSNQINNTISEQMSSMQEESTIVTGKIAEKIIAPLVDFLQAGKTYNFWEADSSLQEDSFNPLSECEDLVQRGIKTRDAAEHFLNLLTYFAPWLMPPAE